MPTSSAVLEAMVKVTGGQQAATELNALGGAVQKTAGQMDASGKAMEAIGNKTATTGQKFNNLGNSLKSNAGSITAVTGSAWGLFNAFDDMEKKVLSTNKAQTMAERSALMLSKAQQKLAAIAAKQGKGSQEYATQLEVVRLAQDKATQSGEKAKIMAGDLQESYVQLAMTAGPQFAVLGGSIAQMVANFSKVGPAAKAGAAGLEVASGGMKSAGMASKLLHLALGPVGLVLLAIGTLFTLYATNAWGFADAVNGVAKAIMDGVGQIWGTIQKVGGQITSFLGALMKDIVSGNIPAALTRIKDLISGIFTEWVKPVFDKIYNFLLDKFSAIATAIGLPIDSAKKMLQGFVDFVFSIFGTLGEGISKAFDALASGDIIGAILAIQDMFNKLVLTVLEAMTVLFTESIPALLVALGGIIMKEVEKWPQFIMDAFAVLADWFATEGPKWLSGIGAAIAAEAPKWIATIMDAFGKLGEFLKLEAMKIPENISASISFWNWDDAWQSLKDAFWSTIIWIKDAGNALPGQILAAILSVDWAGAWQALQDAFNSTVEWIKTNFTWENLAAAFQITRDVFAPVRAAFDTMWNAIKGLFTWANLATGFQMTRDLFNPIKEDFTIVWNAIKGLFTWANLAGAFKVNLDMFAGLKTAFETVWNTIKGIFTWQTLAGGFAVPTNIFAGLGTAFQNVVTLISTAAGGLKLGEKFKIPPNIFSGAADLFSKNVIDPINKTLDEWDVQQKFTDIGKQITDALNAAGVAVGDFVASLNPLPQAEAQVAAEANGMNIAIGNVGHATAPANAGLKETGNTIKETTDKVVAAKPAFTDLQTVLTNFAKNSTTALADFVNKGKTYLSEVTAAVNTFGTETIKKLRETAVELIAQKTFWAQLPAAVREYMVGLQQATLANIDVRQALTDTNYALILSNDGMIKGKEAVKTFVDELVRGKGEYSATQSALQSLATGFGGLPSYIDPTIENLKAFVAANVQGGEAAQKFKEIAISAYQGLTSEATGLIQGIADAISTGGDEMANSWQAAWDKLPPIVRANMDKSTQELINAKAGMSAAGGDAAIGWATSFAAHFGKGAAEAERLADANAIAILNAYKKEFPNMAGVMDTLINEIKTKGPQATQAILRGLQEGVPLAQLIGKDYGTGTVTGMSAGLDGIPGTIDDKLIGPLGTVEPAAGEAGKGAGIALSQEFAAAGTHIASVISGIQANINKIVAPPPIKITVDSAAVATNLNSVQLAINGLKQNKAPIVTVTTVAGHGLVKKLQAAITAMKQARAILISVNTSAAHSAVNKLRSAVNAMPNIKRTITYSYRITGSRPNPPNLNRTITYRYQTVGTRPVSIDSPLGNAPPVLIPMTTGGTMTSGGGGFAGGGGTGGGRPTNFQGDVYLDTYRVGRVMGKAIAENNV